MLSSFRGNEAIPQPTDSPRNEVEIPTVVKSPMLGMGAEGLRRWIRGAKYSGLADYWREIKVNKNINKPSHQ